VDFFLVCKKIINRALKNLALWLIPNQSQHEVQMVNFRYLIYERWNILHELFRIVVHNDIHIDPVLATGKEGFAIVSPESEFNESGI